MRDKDVNALWYLVPFLQTVSSTVQIEPPVMESRLPVRQREIELIGPWRYGNTWTGNYEIVICKVISRSNILSKVKLLTGTCHRTPLILSQHLFRLLPDSSKPLPEPKLTLIYNAIGHHSSTMSCYYEYR